MKTMKTIHRSRYCMNCAVHVEDLRFEATIHLGLKISNTYIVCYAVRHYIPIRNVLHIDLSDSLNDSKILRSFIAALMQLCGHIERTLLVRGHGVVGRVTVLGNGRMSLVRQFAKHMMRCPIAEVTIWRLRCLADMWQAA